MALVSVDEIKTYLRVDTSDDDELLEVILESAEKTCMDIARLDDADEYAEIENAALAEMFTAAYLYEHREDANHNALNLTLRALLFGDREVIF